jgi:outer membrane lipoprotein SlyB
MLRKRGLFVVAVFFVVGCFMGLGFVGCANNARTGALAGSGIGALAGQVIGHDTTSTLIGAGIGLGTGYIIGNEMDKKKAAEQKVARTFAPLGGTTWKIVSISPANKVPKFVSKTVMFRDDGQVVTTTVYPNKSKDVSTENYRVTGNTLIVNRRGYLTNYKFNINGNTMVATAQNLKITLKRLK